MNILEGKKTYIVAIVLAAYSLFGFVIGKVDLNQTIFDVIQALGLAALRHGITTTNK